MDTHNSQSNNGDKFNHLPKSTKNAFRYNGVDLDQLGIELDTLARRALRDGVLPGILKGHEDEIRQEAVILALEWFFRPTHEPASAGGESTGSAWHAPRALAKALKIAKLRYAADLSKDAKRMEPLDQSNGGWALHPSDLLPHEWPESVTRDFIKRSIEVAAQIGRISRANARIGRLILVEKITVPEVAEKRGVNRSAIYQQLRRVLKALPTVIERIEAPPMA